MALKMSDSADGTLPESANAVQRHFIEVDWRRRKKCCASTHQCRDGRPEYS